MVTDPMTRIANSLSVVLVAYNMQRELPRTLLTLAEPYQRGINKLELELLVVDNGSQILVPESEVKAISPLASVTRPEHVEVSPVRALNDAISNTQGQVVCAYIDAARMASPRLISTAMSGVNAGERNVVGALSFHLGRTPQNEAVHHGYNQQVEEELLETVQWQRNGYRLFDISSLDPSSRFGLLACPAETNSLFMRRTMWEEYGGFETRFESRGGGIANLDLWKRVCEDPRNTVVLLVGEGTFHQFHGGTATNALKSPWKEFNREYASIRGHEFEDPTIEPLLYGTPNPYWQAFLVRQFAADKRNSSLAGRVGAKLKKARMFLPGS
jgi:hypothetical protein